MPATLAPEKIETTITAVTELDAAPETAESAGDSSVCYLCPSEAANEVVATCHYCERSICRGHRRTIKANCQTHYDACPACKRAKLDEEAAAYEAFRRGFVPDASPWQSIHAIA